MELSGLLQLICHRPELVRLASAIRSGSLRHHVAVIDPALPALVAALQESLGLPAFVITSSPERARRLSGQIKAWARAGRSVGLLPEPDILPYQRLSTDQATEWERLGLLYTLANTKDPLVVSSAAAASARTLSREDFVASVFAIRPGAKLSLEHTLARLQALGYEPDDMVEVPGTFSRRGGIIDVYSPCGKTPVRVELFGDEVETLRSFDPMTQRSLGAVEQVVIVPAREMLLPNTSSLAPDGKASWRQWRALALSESGSLNEESRSRLEQDLGRLDEGQWFPEAGYYAPVVNTGCVLDFLPQPGLVILDDPQAIAASMAELDRQGNQMRECRLREGEISPAFPTPYLSWEQLRARVPQTSSTLEMAAWEEHDAGQIVMPFGPALSYVGRMEDLLREAAERRSSGIRTLMVSQQATRISGLLEEKGVLAAPQSSLDRVPEPGAISVVQGSVSAGWTLNDSLSVLSDTEIFGSAKESRPAARRPVHHQLLRSELTPGDYVVHVDHGVGMLAGVTTMKHAGFEREYLVLSYAEGDKLYVPVDNLDRITRYVGAVGSAPALSRLRSQEWSKVKERVRRSVADLAGELLSLYAVRETASGFSYPGDSSWQRQMEASFPYVETRDQLEASEMVKREMEKDRPMDRLVCGDVGYGKTEVALRAAFKAITGGKQVAVLVPTTVLAHQHFQTFTERLNSFPVKVEMLCRFVDEKGQQEIIKGLAAGTVDICIGTHRMLQKDVAFKDLGLVVIDEEQRFGVMHKERLKQMRKEVDILTLSATPIPRTLHMAMSGIRDMSLVETPPEDRLPVKTFIGEWENRMVREAILREVNRNGQVLIVNNRVQTIHAVAAELSTLVPEATMVVGHGQMPEEQLEQVMTDFAAGKSDVLVCTTIIESGLDIPRANTLIVKDADRMGLTQLYQLRGRVGRSSLRAYAYFLYPRGKKLTEPARERLSTIAQASELGAGFQVAMRDLEIRGAGNLLGAQQSGHISAVGFHLYSTMLEEAVRGLRARESGVEPKKPAAQGPNIDLPISGYLPHDYVPSLPARLAVYQRLAAVTDDDEIGEVKADLQDRFGQPPLQVERLLYLARVRLLAMKAGVESLSTENHEIVVRLSNGNDPRLKLLAAVHGNKLAVRSNQVRLDTRRLSGEWKEFLPEVLRKLGKVHAVSVAG